MNVPESGDWPHVDLSIVLYRSARWLEGFFRSLAALDYPSERLHLFLTDHGSDDDTVDVCRRWLEANGARFAEWHLVQQPNRGFGSGHNANIARGDSPWILVTNVDLEFEPDSLAIAVRAAVRGDPRGAVREFRQKPYEHPKFYHPVTLETRWSSAACLLLRREAFEQVGGFDESIFMYGEDVELSYRLRREGYRLYYCPKAVCWHYSYREPEEVKPAQFLGSTLANVLIRMRYGRPREIVQGVLQYLGLFLLPPRFEGQRRALLRHLGRLVRHAPHFLMSRKRSDTDFPFRGFDYEFIRDGAFHALPERPSGEPPLVSVIVRTCRGRLGALREATASVVNQTWPRVELVIVEDGSREAEKFARSLAGQGAVERVRYESIPKGGRSAAGNRGLAMASGEFLAFLDDDDLLFADHLEVLVDAMERHDAPAAYATAFETPTEVLNRERWEYREISHRVIHRQPFSRAMLWHHNFIPIQAIVFRRSLYERHGGFEESLEYLEDWDLWVRYSMSGDFVFVNKTTSLYRVPADASALMSRQQKLDEAYETVRRRQRRLRVTLSPAEVVDYARELNAYWSPVSVSRDAVRGALLRRRWAWRFYHRLRRLAHRA